MAAEAGYSIETVRDEWGLSTIAVDWERLSEDPACRSVFAAPGWYLAWLKRMSSEVGPGRVRPHVLVMRHEGVVKAVAPLILRRASRFGMQVRRLEFVTTHADYNHLVVGADSECGTRAVVEHLSANTGEWDVIDLRDLPCEAADAARIANRVQAAGLHLRMIPEEEDCPFLAIDGNSTELMKRLSGDSRRVLRRRMEKAAEAGLRTRIIEHPEKESGLLERLIALDHRKHLHRQSPTFVGSYPEVFRKLIEELGPRNWLYVAMVETGDTPIAFQLGFRCGDRIWDYAKAYDRAFSGYAPGTLLFAALIDYGFEHGFREYDFLRGEEEYKMVWSTGRHKRVRLLIWNQRWSSQLSQFGYQRLRPLYYRCFNRPRSG